MPLTVRAALGLLWSALAIALGASLAWYASLATLPLLDVARHLLGYALLALLLLGIGARNPWARILFAIFLAWSLALATSNLMLGSAQLPLPYRLDMLVLALQCVATPLLFLPASNAWFRRAT
jgi:hypothetical protein